MVLYRHTAVDFDPDYDLGKIAHQFVYFALILTIWVFEVFSKSLVFICK